MTALVVGAAVSGRSAARLLGALGLDFAVYDADPVRAAAAAGEGRRSAGGPWDRALLDGIDLVVVSPGVPEHAGPVVDTLAAEIPLWSEIELAARHLDVPLAAVTGTNGKTTVTEMAAAMLSASGIDARAVGNIGDPLCDAVGAGGDVLVVEVSSFQLRFIDRFRATAAVLLNLAPDHLDWHGSLEAYRAAKMRVFENQGADDIVVFDADDEGAVAAVAPARSRLVPVSGRRRPPGGSGVDAGSLWIGATALDLGHLVRTDPVFLVDAAAAGAAAAHLGASAAGIADALAGYRPGAHRRELVAEGRGVRWVNDSKATNPHAALASIGSFRSVVLIAGGRNKGLDVAALAGHDSVRHVIGIGEAGREIVAAARSGEMAADLAGAVAAAARVAQSGDTILLAPGCASFDMFADYRERGDVFRALAGAAA